MGARVAVGTAVHEGVTVSVGIGGLVRVAVGHGIRVSVAVMVAVGGWVGVDVLTAPSTTKSPTVFQSVPMKICIS